MARLRLGVGELLDHQVFRATELLYDDCTHEGILRIELPTIERSLEVLTALRVAG
jgi:hypothetical protein